MERIRTLFSGKGEGNALKGGVYALSVTALALALLIAVNIFVSALPASLTKLDISASQLYSVTSNTKVVVNALEKDVTVYWVVQAGKEDAVIENLLAKYDSLSSHIRVVKKNPDAFPTFTQAYTDETVQNNSLIVECGTRSRYIPYDNIYLNSASYSYYYSTGPDRFDGEGALTSAIDYVTSEELPRIFLLEGHGESPLPSGLAGQIEKENLETVSLSLLTVDAVPEDAACVAVYAPQSDLSQEERDLLAAYLSKGGRLLVVSGPVEDSSLERFHSLLADYGVETADGVVIESDREYYAGQPVFLLPELAGGEMTDPLIEERYHVIMPVSQGLTVTETANGAAVEELLVTSGSSFSKTAGYHIATYEWEEGDADGPFALGISVETGEGGKLVWFSSSLFLEDSYNQISSGANVNLAMNALSALVGERKALAIRSKSLNYNYLTINASTAALLKVIMIGVCPLVYLGAGVYVVLKRRRMQREPV